MIFDCCLKPESDGEFRVPPMVDEVVAAEKDALVFVGEVDFYHCGVVQ